VLQDVVSVGLLEDFLSLEMLVERFMSCTHTALHPLVLFRVCCTGGALDVIKSLTDVPIVSLYAFKRIDKTSQAVAKNTYVMIRTSRKRSVDSDQISLCDINPKLVTKTTFPSKVVQGRSVGLLSWALLGGFYSLFH
jgi:hypothetical protein